MITEDYVSFEIAKLLKEKGFDCACKVWYAEYTSVWGGDPSGDRKYINIQFDDKNMSDDSYKFLCYAPTLQMAMKWLREKHKIFFNVNYFQLNVGNEWLQLTINLPNKNGCEISFEGFDLEEIYEKAVKYCLENLI